MAAKIVIDGRTINSSSGRYVYGLIDQLQKLDKTNEYVVLVRPNDKHTWTPTAPNWQLQSAPFADFSLREQTTLNGLLTQLEPDLVHFCFPQHPIMYRGRFVVTVHDLTMIHRKPQANNLFVRANFKHLIKQLVFGRVFRRALRRSSHIITPTDYVKQDLIDTFGTQSDKITRIYEAGEQLTAKKTKAIDDLAKKRFILSVSNGQNHKNERRLVEAHQLLLSRYPDLQLVLAGRLNKDKLQLKDVVSRHKLKNIVFTGFISDKQLAWAYRHAQLYVFASLSEGFGLPGLEAMSFDLPLVSSSASCLPEVYGSAAHYFDPLSVRDMGRAIEDVLSSSDLRNTLTANAAKQLRRYGWEQTADQTLAVYKKALVC